MALPPSRIENGVWVVDPQRIEEHIEQGTLVRRRHPTLPLTIHNYTKAAVHQKQFDDVLRLCRGLIVDDDWRVIANPFPKFWNLNETDETKEANLPNEVPVITEKLDGSLAILYPDGGRPALATRGTFDGPQAQWATRWLQERQTLDAFRQGYTYLFECIYPENRELSKLVTDYGDRAECVLLAVRRTADGQELDHVQEAQRLGLSHTRTFSFGTLQDIVQTVNADTWNDEGFVVHYPQAGLRVKIKSKHYQFKARLLTQLTKPHVWGWLKQGRSIEALIAQLPQHVHEPLRELERTLRAEHESAWQQVRAALEDLEARAGLSEADRAKYILATYPRISRVLFEALKGASEKELDGIVWRLTKPKASGR